MAGEGGLYDALVARGLSRRAFLRFAVATTAGVGCDITSRTDGTPCAADGLSGECVEGALHGADVCVAGECVDAGESACPSAFCEQALCTGAGDCAARATSPGVRRTRPRLRNTGSAEIGRAHV